MFWYIKHLSVAANGNILMSRDEIATPFPYPAAATDMISPTGQLLWHHPHNQNTLPQGHAWPYQANANGDVAVPWAEYGGTGDDDHLTRYTPQGTQVYDKVYPDGIEEVEVRTAATDGAGNSAMVATVNPSHSHDFGGGVRLPGDYLVKFNATGAYQWDLPISGVSGVRHLLADSSGNFYISGVAPGGMSACPINTGAVYIAKLNANGGCLWSHAYSGNLQWEDIALMPNEDVVLYAHLMGSTNFGGSTLTSGSSETIAAVRLNPGGGHVWSATFGNATTPSDDIFPVSISDIGTNDTLFLLRFSGTFDFGFGALTAPPTHHYVLLKVSASGTPVAQHLITHNGARRAAGLANGDALVANRVKLADYGCGPIPDESPGRIWCNQLIVVPMP